VLESFKFRPDESVNILNQQNKEVKTVGFGQVMAAYSQYKTLQPHE
jgi:osmoprotectant transport system ATP-binding protein